MRFSVCREPSRGQLASSQPARLCLPCNSIRCQTGQAGRKPRPRRPHGAPFSCPRKPRRPVAQPPCASREPGIALRRPSGAGRLLETGDRIPKVQPMNRSRTCGKTCPLVVYSELGDRYYVVTRCTLKQSPKGKWYINAHTKYDVTEGCHSGRETCCRIHCRLIRRRRGASAVRTGRMRQGGALQGVCIAQKRRGHMPSLPFRLGQSSRKLCGMHAESLAAKRTPGPAASPRLPRSCAAGLPGRCLCRGGAAPEMTGRVPRVTRRRIGGGRKARSAGFAKVRGWRCFTRLTLGRDRAQAERGRRHARGFAGGA